MLLIDIAKKIAENILRSNNIHIVAHRDADGVAAASIAVKALERAGIDYSVEFVKQLDDKVSHDILNKNPERIWLVDLGSNFDISMEAIITDHHECLAINSSKYHLNPHLFGLDGTIDISGAGVTYLVARAMDRRNRDLSSLAIVGACGDLQDRRFRRLVGTNREILHDGIKCGVLDCIKDIQYFGRETKPVYKLLQYATDPIIPGLSGTEEACIAFLADLEIQLKQSNSWRRWVDLNKDEKRKILSSIAKRLLERGFGAKEVRKLVGEVYIIKSEHEGTELHDAREFATLLNATARHGFSEIGLQICLGNREDALKKARSVLQSHRQDLSNGLQIARHDVMQREYLRYFHAKDNIKDTVVGIITSILLEENGSDLPIVGFAVSDDGRIKVSARCAGSAKKRLDLSIAIHNAAKKVGGTGGGHSTAAGATIPAGSEDDFLKFLEEEIKEQLLF